MSMPPLIDAFLAVLGVVLAMVVPLISELTYLMSTCCEHTDFDGFLAYDTVRTLAFLILSSQIHEIGMLSFQGVDAFCALVSAVFEDLERSLVELLIKLFFVRCDCI